MKKKKLTPKHFFSDYRDINGIMLPFAMEVESDANPMGTQNIVMDEMNQNVEIDDNIFVMPEKTEDVKDDVNDNE